MICLMAVWIPGQSLQGATITWDISGVTGIQNGGGAWNTVLTNWTANSGVSNVAWNNGTPDSATFGGGEGAAGTVTLGEAITADTITFATTTAGIYTIAGGANTLTVNNGVTANQNTILATNVALGATQTWTVAAGKQLTATGIISGTTFGISKAGAGTLVLSGVNTFTGPVALSAGILRATTSVQALGTVAATLSLDGGELQLANDTALNFARNTTVTANSAIASDRLTGGAGVNHTLGTLSIGAQTLQMKSGQFVNSGNAQVTFGATMLSGNATFNVGNATTGAAASTNMPMLSLGAIDDGGTSRAITKTGNGILDLSANAATFTAGTAMAVNAGTLRLRTLNAFSSGVNVGALSFGGGHLELFAAATVFNNSVTLGANNATITLSGTGARNAVTQTLGALSLGSTLTITHGTSLNANNTDSLTFGATTLTGNATIIANNVNGAGVGVVTLGGIVSDGSNGYSLTKGGAGTLSLNTGASTFTGAININSGLNTSNVSAGTLDISGTATVQGVSAITATRNSTLQLNNTSAGNNVADRLLDSATIGLTGATFSFANTAVASTAYAESVGAITINAGANVINSTQANATAGTTTLTVADLVRVGSATLNFTGTGLGDATRNRHIYTLIGGVAPTGNQFIGSWATVNGVDFAKWDTTGTLGSIRALQAGDYTGTFGAGNNVLVTATGTAGAAAKSLNIKQATATTLSITTGTTLTIDDGANAGAILVSGSLNSILQSTTTTAATLTAGNAAGAQLIFHINSPTTNPLTLSATNAVTITDNPNAVTLIKTGTGTLVLNTAATYTGGTILNQGGLRINNITALGAATNALTLSGGALELGNTIATTYGYNTTVADRANVAVNHVYTAAAAGVAHTLGTLSIGTGTLSMAAGTNVNATTTYGNTFGATTLTGNPTFVIASNGTAAGTLTLGALNDGGVARTLTREGSGTNTASILALGTNAATFTAGTNAVLNFGSLQLRTANAFSSVANAGTINFGPSGSGVLDLFSTAATTFNNNLVLGNNAGTVRISRAATGGGVTHTAGTVTIGTAALTVAVGSSMDNNSGYGLTLGATTLTGNPTFTIANNGSGVGTITLGQTTTGGFMDALGSIADGGIARSITKTGSGALALRALPSQALGFVLGGGTVQMRNAGNASVTTGATGLNAYYFNAVNFGNNDARFATNQLFTTPRVFTRTDANINVPNTGGGTHPVIPVAGFAKDFNHSIAWKGLINITTGGAYTFKSAVDDVDVLWIDGVQVGAHAGQTSGNFTSLGTINLTAGQHSIYFQFGQGSGGGYEVLQYSGADTSNVDTIIPSSVLSTGWLTQSIGPLSVIADSTLDIAHDTVAPSLTLGAFTLTVASATISNLYINGPTVLTGNARVTPSTGGVIFNGGISGAFTLNIGSTTANVLSYLTQFNAVNTFTGLLTVNGGVLRLNASGGNSVAGNVTLNVAVGNNGDRMPNIQLLQSNQIADAATLALTNGFFDLNGQTETVTRLDVTGGTLFGAGTLTVSALNTGTISSGFIESDIAGAGGLNKTGAGTLMWTGGGSYTGATAISAGTFIAASSGALGAGGGGNGTTISGTGLLVLAGNTSFATEDITLNSANGLRVFGQSSLGTTLTYGAAVTADTLNVFGGKLTLGNATTSVNGSAGNTNLTIGGTGEVILSSAVNLGTGTLTKTGNGTLTFGYDVGATIPTLTFTSGALGFSGTQSFGTATVAADKAFQFNTDPGPGVTAVTVGSGATVIANFAANQAFLGRIASASNGVLLLGADSGNNLNFNTGSHDLSLGASGRVVYSGTLTPNGATYRLGAANAFGYSLENTLVLTQALTGATNAVNVTGGHVDLSRAVNTFGGALNIGSGGVVTFNNSNSLGGTGAAVNAINLTNGGTLRVARNAASHTGSFSLLGYSLPNAVDRTVTVGSGGGTLDVVGSAYALTGLALGGVNALQGSAGNTLTKTGAGTLFLVNSNNFAGDIVLGAQGGTLDLRYLGKLTSANSITINQSAILNIDETNGLGPARNGGYLANTTEADRINASTTVNLAGGTFSFTTGNASGRNSEALGTVNLQQGQSLFNFTSNTGSGVGSDVSVTNFNVLAGGTLRLGGGTPGTFGTAGANNTRFTFNNLAINGGSFTHAAAANFVMPFASIGTTDHAIYTGTGFAPSTYTNHDLTGTVGGSINPTANTLVTRLRNLGTDNTTSTFTLAGEATNRYGVTGLSITGAATGGGAGVTNNITLAFTNATDSLFVGATNSLGGGAIIVDGTTVNNNNRTMLIGASANSGILTAGAIGATTAQTLYLRNRSVPNGSGNVVFTINSVIRNNAGADFTFGNGDDTALTIVKDNNGNINFAGTNLYTGGTYITSGRLTGNVASAFGTGQVVVKNAAVTLAVAGTVSGTAVPTATPVFDIMDQSELFLSGTAAAYTNANDRFRVAAGSLLTAESDTAAQGLNSLTRVTTLTGGGQVILAPGAIIRTTSLPTAGSDLGVVNMVQNLGTAADLYFNVDSGSALSYITVGAGTPWRGFAAGTTGANWRTGTIYANSDFELQGTFNDGTTDVMRLGRQDGGSNTANSYSIVNLSGKAINAYVDGQVTLSEDTPLSMPSDLTFVVRNGATLTPEFTNSFGSGANVAKVVVQAGGTLDPGSYAAVGLAANQAIGYVYPIAGPLNASSTTIEAGGRLLLNDASGLGTSPVGSITLKTNSVLQLGNAQAFLGANAGLINVGQIVLEAGVIVRAEISDVFRFTDFINGVTNGDKIILQMHNGTRSMTAATNPFLSLNSATPYIEAQSITFGSGGGLTGDAADGRIAGPPGLAGAYSGAYVFNTGSFLAATSGSYLNVNEDIIVASGQTVNIGHTGYIDGLPKLGGVQLGASNGNKIAGTLTILPGAQLTFAGVNTYNDTQSLNLSTAVSNHLTGGILPGTGTSLLINNTTAEVMGSLTGEGAVIGNSNPSTLHVGYGDATFTFNGVFSSGGTQQVNLGKVGSGIMTITGNGSTSTGTLNAYNGTMKFSGNGAAQFATYNVFQGGTLLLDNGTNTEDATAVSGRLGGATKNLTMAGGEFKLLGRSNAVVTEALGVLGLSTAGGTSYVTVDTTNASTLTLNFASVTNSNNASNGTTYVLRGQGMAGTPGTTSAAGVVTANAAANGLIISATPNLWTAGGSNVQPNALVLVGGGNIAGSVGTALAPVRVDILGDTSTTGIGTGFVTMDSATSGFRLLANSEYYAGTRIVQNENLPINVKLAASSSLALTGGSTTIESLTMLNGSSITVSGNLPFSVNPARLQVTTGGIYVPTGATATITAPYLTPLLGFNINLYFQTQGDLTVNSPLVVGTGRTSSLVKSGAGTLTLGANALTDMAAGIFVNEGTLVLGGTAAQNKLFVTEASTTNSAQFNGQRVVLNGGSFDLNGQNQIFGELLSNGGLAANSSSSELSGGNLTSTGAARVVVQSTSNATANTNVFAGTITGAITLDKSGVSNGTAFNGASGTLVLTNSNSYTGGTVVRAGTLRLRDDGALTSALGGIAINQATLILDNTGLGNLGNRINNSSVINSRSGTLQLLGSRDAAAESLGTVNTLLGLSTIQVGAGHSSKAELTIANLVRSAGATVVMNATASTGDSTTGGGALGYPGDTLTNPRIFLTQVGGVAVTLNDGILGGWATSGTNFLSYSATNGVGELGNLAGGFANYAMNVTTGAFTTLTGSTSTADNIRLNAADTLTTSKTVNALLLAQSAARVVTLTGQVLTLDSGGLLVTGDFAGTFTGGSLTSGGAELFVTVNQNTTSMSTAITGAGVSLVKSGPGGLTLTGDNTFGGTTYVNAGTLTLNRTSAGFAVQGDININGGTLTLSKVSQINTSATVTLNGGSSSLNLNATAGWTDTLKKLVFNNTGGTTRLDVTGTAGTLILTDPTPIVVVNDNTTTGALISTAIGVLQFAPSSGTTSTIDVSGLAPFGMLLNPNITAAPSGGLIKAGTGLLALGGTNTYAGATSQVWDIQAGILRADSAGALGNDTSDITNVGAAGTLLIFGAPALTGRIDLNGGTLALTAGNSSIAVTTGQLNAVASTTSTINLSEFYLSTSGRTLTVAGQLTGSGNIDLDGPGLTSSGAAAIMILTNSANTYSGTITVNNNTTLRSSHASANTLGSAIINLAGGTLNLTSDASTSFSNVVNLTANSFVNVDRNSGTTPAVTHTIGTLNVAAGDMSLTVSNANSSLLTIGTLNGPGTLIKRNNVGTTITALGTVANTPGIGLAGADGRTTGHTFNTTTAANLTFTPATIGLTEFDLGGFYITPASKTFNVTTFSVSANTGNLPGALAVTNTTTLNATNFANNGQVGASGGTATITSANFTGSGHYVTNGQALNLATSTGGVTAGTLRVAGNNTVTLTGTNNNTLAGGVQVQSGTLRVQPNTASTSPLGSGTVQVFGAPASVASASSAPIAAVSAQLQLDSTGGAISHTGNITNSGIVRAVAGTSSVSGVIKGTALSYTPGLLEGQFTANALDTTNARPANVGNWGVRLEPRMGQTNAVTENALTGWTSNNMWVYTGYIKDTDGIFSFAENIDDRVAIWVDGNLVLSNITSNIVTSTAYSIGVSGTTVTAGANLGTPTTNFGSGITLAGYGDGWHLIEIRLQNGTGGGGATAANGFGANFGLGFKDGIGALDGADYIKPIDDGTGNLFVTPQGGKGQITIDTGAILNAGAVDLTSLLTLSGAASTLNVTGNGSTNAGLSIIDTVAVTTGNSVITVVNNTHALNLGDSATPNGSGVLTVPAAGTLTLGSGASNGVINVFGNNAASLTGPGGVIVAGGVVRMGSANAFGDGSDTLTINGGVLASLDATARTLVQAIVVGGDFTLGQVVATPTNTAGGSGNLTFSNSINLGAAVRQVTVIEPTADMLFSAIISGAGGLTKAGTGKLTLSGNNIFNGNVSVNAGVLNIQHANALGDTTGTTTVNNNATLQLQGGITTTAEILTLNGTGAAGQSGALVNFSGANNFAGPVTLASNATISSDAGTLTLSNTNAVTHTANETVTFAGAGNTAVSGIISLGSGGITKIGLGTTTLTGANTFTGAVNANAGVLQLNATGALGTPSAVNVADVGTLNLGTGGGTFTLGGTGAVLNLGSTAAGGARLGFTINGATNDQINLTDPAATVVVTAGGAFADIYVTGAPTLASYVLINSAADGSFSGGTFSIGSIFNGGSFIYDLVNPTNGDSINDQLILNVTAGTTPPDAYWKGDLGGSGTGVWIASQAVSGNRTNWSTALATNVDAASVPGLLGTTGPNGEIASYFWFSSASPANLTTTLGVDTTAQAVTFLSGNPVTTVGAGNTLTIIGAVTGAANGLSVGDGLTLQAGTANASFANSIILGASQNWSVADSGDVLTVSGVVSDGGSNYNLNLHSHGGDAGTIVLSNANTYGGTTTVNRGILNIQHATALGGVTNGTSVASGATLQFQGGFTLGAGGEAVSIQGSGAAGQTGALVNVSGNNTWSTQIALAASATIGSDSGLLTLNAATASLLGTNTNLTVAGAGNTTLGAFNLGAATLTKNGTGTLTLTGNNTYSGATTITAGIVNTQTLTALGDATTGTSVTANATLQIQGGLTFAATDEALTITGSGAAGQSGALVSLSGTNAYNRTLLLGGAASIGTVAGSLTFGHASAISGTDTDLTFNSVGATTVSGGISIGAGALVKNNTGTLTLAAANTYSGDTTVNNGILNIGHASSLGDAVGATTVVSGATLQLNTGLALTEAFTLSGTGFAGQPGALVGIAGTSSISGAVSLGAATTISVTAGTLSFTNTDAITGTGTDLTLAGAGNSAVSGIIALGAGGVTKAGLGTITLSGANTYTGATAITAGILNAQHATALGAIAGATTITSGATLQVQGGISIGAEAISLAGTGASGQSGALVNVSGNNTLGGTLTLTGNATIASLAGLLTVDTTGAAINGSATNLTVTGAGNTTVADAITTGSGTVTKSGTGTLTLSAVNTYTGATNVQDGTLTIGVDNALVTTSTLNLGLSAGTTVGTVDLSGFSQTVGALNVVSNTATANTINIGTGETLTVNGLVTVGYNSNANTTTRLNVSGLGAFVVNAVGDFQVGGNITTDRGNSATLDMSGLATFTANLGTGTFRVGDNTNSGGGGTGNSTAILATTTTITAAAVDIEADVSGGTQTLRLGNGNGTIDVNGIITSGGNIFNVGTLNVGYANGRSSGILNFNHATDGTFKLRNQAGTGRAIFNVGVDEFTTGIDNLSNSANLDGHHVDLLVSTLTIATRGTTATGNTTATFAMDTGKLDATAVVIGNRSGTTAGTANGTMDIGGGTVAIGNTGISIANNAGTTAVAGTATGLLSVSGGTVTVGTGGITLGNSATATNTASATITITGGTVTMGGNIVEGTGAGNATVTSTITLEGGTLNMGGFNIGSTNAINNVNLRSGTLSNVNQINNGGAVSKTTSGTLTVAGSNTYTGATTVADGILHVAGTVSSSAITVNKVGGTLATASVLSGGGNGTTTGVIGAAVTVGVTGGTGILKPGTTAGGADHNRLTLTAAGTALTVIDGSQLQLGISSTTVAPTLSFENGVYTFNGANYTTAGALFDAQSTARSTWNTTPTDATSHDFLRLTGSGSQLSIGNRATGTFGDGSVLVTGSISSPAYGQVFNLIDWVNASSIQGAFSVGASNFYDATSTVSAGDLDLFALGAGFAWDVSAFKNHGILVVVPEPSRALFLLLGLLGLMLRRRRRFGVC